MPATKFDIRQSVLRPVLNMAGNSVNETVDSVLSKIDAQVGKLFEDRNVLLTDGGLVTFTGTQIQFTENLKLSINSKIAGGSPVVISLGSANVNLNNLDMWYAIVNRVGGTATTAVISSATGLPAVNSANQEIWLIAKRVDAGDGTQRVYFRDGMALNAGQSVRLGSAGSGSGTGTGDDLDSLEYNASFSDNLDEPSTAALSAVLATNALYVAAKGMYQISYDASKTVTGTGTSMTISSAPGFTIAANDVLINRTTGEVKKIIAITSQVLVTIESAFATNPSAVAMTVSQAVITKDLNSILVDGNAISTAFSTPIATVLVDYEDNDVTNSGLFELGQAPVVAFTASSDGSLFSLSQKRPTLPTDSTLDLDLPSAGSNLYLRFFANKTSSSGIVNILRYKAFLHKSLVGQDGSPLDQAYCFTDSSITPIGCSNPVVLGGKTTLSLNFACAIIDAGKPESSIDVYINGTKIPQFIDAPSTPDSWWKFLNASTIQLDKDYSIINVSLLVVKRITVLDNTSANTSNISYLQDIARIGQNAFIGTDAKLQPTTVTGSPAAGKFYSTIVGRAPIPDLTQDLKPRMGADRFKTANFSIIQDEFSPTNRPVYRVDNDKADAVRLVGRNWRQGVDGNGVYPSTGFSDDYIEFTFYGTGINALLIFGTTGSDFRVSVDGGSEGANIVPAGLSGVLQGQGFEPAQVVPLANGLALGIHTVKLRLASPGGVNLDLQGYEIINDSGLVKTNPGISYNAGKKVATVAQASFAYNAMASGTKGGRTSVYQAADGSIGSAFRPTDASVAYLSAANHANEEVVDTYDWKEFGSYRGDDFSTVDTITNKNQAHYTLSDGLTTLVDASPSGNLNLQSGLSGYPIFSSYINSSIRFTFIGTGLDITCDFSGAGGDSYPVYIDGISLGNINPITGGLTVSKIASGLPYGTHVCLITIGTPSQSYFNMLNAIVYQPKKPTIPPGATELGDYNIMANFVANVTASLDNLATGILRRQCNNGWIYTGTASYAPDVINCVGGATVEISSADYGEFTFFGTGFDFRFHAQLSASYDTTVFIDGVLYTGAATAYGGAVWTPGSGSLNQNATLQPGAGLTITGLALGLHTLRLKNNSGVLEINALDVITPIHSYKAALPGIMTTYNTMLIGSQGIADDRRSGPLDDLLPVSKAWVQVEQSGVPTTTATAYNQIPGAKAIIKTKPGEDLRIVWNADPYITPSSYTMSISIFVDGKNVGAGKQFANTAGLYVGLGSNIRTPVSAGTHIVELMWATQSGSTASFANWSMTVEAV